jgi:hypothetical protein
MGGFQWTAESEIERPASIVGYGKTLTEVKEFALVCLCERTGKLERLSEMHPPDWENRMQTTWGWGVVFPQRKTAMSTKAICTPPPSPEI